jgi:hypothetical protein
VRIHADVEADESARSVRAVAYTVGHDVVLGRSRRDSAGGMHTLAHELAHVVQQERGGPSPADPGHHNALERGAAAAAFAFVAGPGPIDVAGASAPGLARQPLFPQEGGAEPQSLTGTLVLDEEVLKGPALEREITLIEQWLDQNPLTPGVGTSPWSWSGCAGQDAAGTTTEGGVAGGPTQTDAQAFRRHARCPKQYEKALNQYSDDPSWLERFDLETLQGIVEDRFLTRPTTPGWLVSWSGAKWPWYQKQQLDKLKDVRMDRGR